MGDGLRVGLGAAIDHLLGQPGAQREVVLDDSVQHDPDAAARIRVRMGVLLGDAAVGRPACVADAGLEIGRRDGSGAGHCRHAGMEFRLDPGRQGSAQGIEVADRAHMLDVAILAPGDPGRVVATVLQSSEPIEQDLLGVPVADITNDSAHNGLPSGSLAVPAN